MRTSENFERFNSWTALFQVSTYFRVRALYFFLATKKITRLEDQCIGFLLASCYINIMLRFIHFSYL